MIRTLSMIESTSCCWRQFAGLFVAEIRRLTPLQHESTRHRKLMVDLISEKARLQILLRSISRMSYLSTRTCQRASLPTLSNIDAAKGTLTKVPSQSLHSFKYLSLYR